MPNTNHMRTFLASLAASSLIAGGTLAQSTPAAPAHQAPAHPTQPAADPKKVNNHEPTTDATPAAKPNSAIVPVSRGDDANWMKRHESFNARVKQGAEKGDIGMLFIGDSITHGWEGEGAKDVWAEYYAKRNAVNLGIGGDRTQHVLWRLENGNLAGLDHPKAGSSPKAAVIMIGTNNSNGNDNTAEEIAAGVKAIIADLHAKVPTTKVLLLAIFPRGEKPNPQREKLAAVNAMLAKMDDGKQVFFLDIGPKFLTADGTLTKEIMPDFLHLSPKGYRIEAEAIEAKVKELMGEK